MKKLEPIRCPWCGEELNASKMQTDFFSVYCHMAICCGHFVKPKVSMEYYIELFTAILVGCFVAFQGSICFDIIVGVIL